MIGPARELAHFAFGKKLTGIETDEQTGWVTLIFEDIRWNIKLEAATSIKTS